MNNLQAAGMFLINVLFDLCLFILAIRLILVWVRANVFNPFSQFIFKLTEPTVRLLRRALPTFKHFETSTAVLLLAVEMLKLIIITLLFYDGIPGFGILMLLALMGAIKTILNTFFFAILFYAILSWVQPGPSPIAMLLAQISAPIMQPLRRIIPPVAGFDITPIPALIILQLMIMLL